MLTYAASWNAKLLDASCASSNTSTGEKKSSEKLAQACAPTATTTAFAIEANGKVYTLDPAGNEKAASAMKSGTLKPDKDGDFHATVQGTAQGNTIKVDSVSGGKQD
jgi:hypothetical protein